MHRIVPHNKELSGESKAVVRLWPILVGLSCGFGGMRTEMGSENKKFLWY